MTLKPELWVTQGHLAPFPRYTAISVENRQFYHPRAFITAAQESEETRMLGLPEGRKSFKIVGLAVLKQYRRVADSQPPALYVARVMTSL